jgi:hypothetical protein
MIGLERLVHWRGAGPCIWSHDRTKRVGGNERGPWSMEHPSSRWRS